RSRSRWAARGGRSRGRRSCRFPSFCGRVEIRLRRVDREAHLESGVAGLRFHLEVSVMLVHDDAPGDVPPEARALADPLARGERLKDPVTGPQGATAPGATEPRLDQVALEVV